MPPPGANPVAWRVSDAAGRHGATDSRTAPDPRDRPGGCGAGCPLRPDAMTGRANLDPTESARLKPTGSTVSGGPREGAAR